MAKRQAAQQRAPKASKRRKVDDPVVVDGPRQEIHSVKDLHELVFFDQSSATKLRSNLVQFEEFVKSIESQPADSKDKAILLKFLTVANDDPTSTPLNPLFQTWSYALDTGNDGLLRIIPVALATLLEAISRWIDFRSAGSLLCRALLLQEQRKCIEKCLQPDRQQAGIIIGTLRLLTQIVAYDAGTHASGLHRLRSVYRSLEQLLASTARDYESPKKEERHFSVRYSAVRFLLANFRHQGLLAKSDLLMKTSLSLKMFQTIDRDPPELILDVIQISQQNILKDNSLPVTAKQGYLVEPVLIHTSKLLRFDKSGSNYEPVAQRASEFLVSACTSSEEGVVRAAEKGSEFDVTDVRGINGTEQALSRTHTSASGVDLVKPSTLSKLLEKIRPESSSLERSLTLAIFEKHPNLIAEYFNRSKAQFDPKLTAYWVGYSSFLLSVIMLPLPTGSLDRSVAKSGDHTQESIIKASILPHPLNRYVLEKCFTKCPPLVTFFASRILLAACSKLETYLSTLREEDTNIREASQPVLSWFCQKCPRAQAVLAASPSGDDFKLLQEQLSRLISRYCTFTPKLIMDPDVDMAGVLAAGLDTPETVGPDDEQDELLQMHVDNLLQIASSSPDLKWAGKTAKGATYSACTSVLRTCILRRKTTRETLGLIQPVLRNHSILQNSHPDRALAALLQSFQLEITSPNSHMTFAFFDNCLAYLFKYDLKYMSMLFELIDKLDLRRDKEVESFSLLTVAIGDQWQFAVSSKDAAELIHIAQWVGRYIEAMDDAGESRTILRSIRADMAAQTQQPEAKAAIRQTLADGKKLVVHPKSAEGTGPRSNGTTPSKSGPASTQATKKSLRRELDMTLRPSSEPENYPALTRWKRKDVLDALDDGTVAELASCLSASALDIRRQGLAAIQTFIPKVQSSDTIGKTQLYLLLSELSETASSLISTTPLPHLATSFVRLAIPILQDPLHAMYPKVNDFLLQRPAWSISRLPSYWLTTILLRVPSVAGSHARELAWLLSVLHAGLQTDADAELYRANGTVERVLSRCAPASVGSSVARDALHLMYRWTFFAGGADTLVTRCGILAWIETGLARCRREKDENRKDGQGGTETEVRYLTLLCLLDRIVEASDEERLKNWSDGAVTAHIARLRRMYDRE